MNTMPYRKGDRIKYCTVPTYDNLYAINYNGYQMRYVYRINRDNLMTDLFQKLIR